jgi:hypothetical protein
MASTIITKNSSTASAVPVVGDLTKGELAVNVTDKKIYTKDNSAAVVKLVGSLGNQEANAVAITGGSIAGITDLAVADGGTGASTASDARTNLGLGTIATQAASSVTITGGSVTGITDITVADGGTGASTAANARSNLGAAASGANSDITSLLGLTTALSVAQGGTGITSFGSGVATFLGTPSSANLLAAVTDETGTGSLVFANTPTLVTPILGTPTSGNFSTGTFTWPTFNQNTTGTAAGLSATLAIASGGTGATTAGGALTSLGAYPASNPSGYTSNTGTVTSVGGTGTVNGLTLTGTVTTSGNLTLGGTLSGVSLTSQVSGTLPTANGGTNLGGATPFTSGGVVYASSSSVLATGSALVFDGFSLGIGASPTATLHVKNANLTSALLVGSQSDSASWGMFSVNGDTGSATGAGMYGKASASLYFNAPTSYAHVWTINGGEIGRFNTTGLGIGTSLPTARLDVSYGGFAGSQGAIAMGADVGANTSRTNATRKFGVFSGVNYTNAEENITFIYYDSDGTNNYIGYGGGPSGFNAATIHQWFTAATPTTTGGTERMRLDSAGNLTLQKNISVGGATVTTSGTGITFPATQSASSDANTLDDYEEGTWTPAVGDQTVVGTFSSNGNYTKIGRQVFFRGQVIGSTSITGAAGSFISGLPFTSALSGTGIGTNAFLTASAGIFIGPSDTKVYIIGGYAATGNFEFSGMYFV